MSFRPDSKTQITAEMDYLHNELTPNRGTVNLAAGDTNALYETKEKFFGFKGDNTITKALSYMITAERKLTDKLKIRAAYMSSDNATDTERATALAAVRGESATSPLRQRRVTKGYGEDRTQVFQADFIGQEIKTGFLKHTFQIGFDFKESQTMSKNYRHRTLQERNRNTGRMEYITYIPAGNIDVTGEIDNNFTANLDDLIYDGTTYSAKNPTYGIMAQEVMQIGKYVKAIMGVRYSVLNGQQVNNSRIHGVQQRKSSAFDPSFGLMISPMENINIYGSYTTTTNLAQSHRVIQSGGTAGALITRQFEAGVKSDWFDERLRFNINLYSMDMNNLTYEVRTNPDVATEIYEFAGDLTRKGVEVDLIGKILPQLEVMAGYAYLDAQYKNSPVFVNGSAPIMAAKHTANGWLNYTIKNGFLRGLNFGGGVYYVGERPVNDYTQTAISRGHINEITPGIKPFHLNAYTTINAQIGYTYKNASIRIFANNLTDSVGYSTYFRGGYINRTDPRNFAVQVNYKF